MTQEAASLPQPLTEAAPITFRAGRATISLHKVVDGFHVLTMQGTRRVDAWSCSYPDERTARVEARRAALAFMHHRTADALAAECTRLADAIEARRRRRANADDLRVKLAAVQPLTAAARDAEMKARWTASADLMHAIRDLPTDERLDALQAARDSFDALHTQPAAAPRRTYRMLRDEFAATHATSN